jgi:signal transduction histidine kinase
VTATRLYRGDVPPAAISAVPRRFFGVVARPQTWKNLLYLALAFPLGVAYVVVLAVGLSTGAGLAIVFVGLGILFATLMAWRGMAALERGLARSLLGVRIPLALPREAGLPLWARVKLWVRDPVTWKSFVFVVAKLPMGIVALAALAGPGFVSLVLVLAPLITVFVPIVFFGWEIADPLEALPLVPVGVLACVATLHLFNGLSWLYGLTARVMLGPSSVELRERVDDLRGSRARILAAADEERRRIERDLHDGAQQRLVSLSLTLGLAEGRLTSDPPFAARLVREAREEAQRAVQELRELARGIHPALLSERGLEAALDALAARAPLPVEITGVPAERLPPQVEAALYFTTAEALTNVAKYAGAEHARVTIESLPGFVSLEVSDDGSGGADPAAGSGLRGLRDRVEALDGRLEVVSAPRQGTTVIAVIPPGGSMRRAAVVALVALVTPAAAGCGSGPETTQTRDVGAFSHVRAEGDVDVAVRAGPPGRVTVRAGEDVIHHVVTEVVGDTLVVRRTSRGLVIGPDALDDARVLVELPRLRGASSTGSSDLEVSGLKGGALLMEVEGSGDLSARGRVNALDATVEGSGDAELLDLSAHRAAVRVEGSGDAEVHAVRVLRAVVEGSGSIRYRGEPGVATARSEGSGEIERE